MLIHPNFDAVAVAVGPVAVHWYGLMYLAGFAAGGWLGVLRCGKNETTTTKATAGINKTATADNSTAINAAKWRRGEIADLVFYCAVGAVVGGRLGYAIFYQPLHFAENPLAVLAIWQGGMAFHGGLLGVAAAVWLYAKRTQRRFLAVGDFLAPLVIPGLGFGRLGNFINQELWGRTTEVAWGMLFHTDPAGVARHPSQLYQFALEGVVLFAVVWIYSARPRAAGRVCGVFLAGYAAARFAVEFFREPDAHLGTVLAWMTMGQVLCIPMAVLGCWLWLRRV